MFLEDRRHLKKLILWAAPVFTLACGGDGGIDVVLPSLRVITTTTGVEIDSDGYSVSINGASAQPIGVNSTVTADGLRDGQYVVELSGLALNCAVQGENPRTVSVVAGATATADFVIGCSSGAGSLQVSTATGGTGTDPDGFSLLLDGVSAGVIGASAATTLTGILPGPHTVELTGLAVNCQVTGENPRPVSVPAGGAAQVQFSVTCATPGPNTGTVDVVTATGGGGTDADGFSIVVDGVDRGPIALTATSSLGGIPAGFHAVGLTGVAANCQVAGENPRQVSVAAGGTARVEFAITCTAPGPNTGTLEVVTNTSGGGTDPDGFSLLLDGIDRGGIGINTTSSLPGMAPGSHTIGLSGLAANCQIAGENPRLVSVPGGGVTRVSFAITCAAPGPTTGTLRITTVTTGSAPDADGYVFSVDGAAGRPIGTSTTVPLTNISAGQHTVELRGLAPNCSVTGTNPVGAALSAGETVQVSFAITCPAIVGSLRVTVSGLPASVAAAVTVAGPNNFSQPVTESRTFGDLPPGAYAVTASQVVSGNSTYTPSVGRPTVDVVAGATAAVTVSYTGVSNVTLNLRIDGAYLTQSTQTYDPSVPLVSGRNGYLRVFVVANEGNTARPAVRVRLSNPERTLMISAPGQVPTRVDEGSLASSWNIEIPGSSIQPGLAVTAELDPDNEVKESNENDNRFPASGAKALVVQSVPPARIRFISVQQGTAPPGDVSNVDRLTDLARRMHPLNGVDVDVGGSVYPTGPLSPNGDGWFQLLSDLDGKRVLEGSDRIYFGVVRLGYGRSSGLVGLTLGQGVPTAAGWDDAADGSRVVAHELGHVWGRKHSPCGNPPDVGQYPYAGGIIGAYGMDVARTNLKPRSSPDIMSYCFDNPWISDFTYKEVMNFRTSNTFVRAANTSPQTSLLVWGRLVNGRPVLEPAFQIVALPSLPRRPGPYSVTGTALDGTQLFRISFDVAVSEDGPPGNGHFAFTVPLDQARALSLQNLRLAGPAGTAMASKPLAQLRVAPGDPLVAQREGANVLLRWDAAAYPMIMVRDPDTGEVLSFARGGRAVVQTSKELLDLDISDGVRSQRVRLAISRS